MLRVKICSYKVEKSNENTLLIMQPRSMDHKRKVKFSIPEG